MAKIQEFVKATGDLADAAKNLQQAWEVERVASAGFNTATANRQAAQATYRAAEEMLYKIQDDLKDNGLSDEPSPQETGN